MTPAAFAMGTRLTQREEAFMAAPYPDSAGRWTIGYGTTYMPDGSPVTAHTAPVTRDGAATLMAPYLVTCAAAIDAFTPDGAPDWQAAALLSFAYNEGVHAFSTSTLARLWLAGDTAGAANEFEKWDLAGGHVNQGLVNRRKLERAVFLGLTAV